MHCRMSSSIMGLYPLDASHRLHPHLPHCPGCDHKHFQVPNVPWEAKSPLVKNHCPRYWWFAPSLNLGLYSKVISRELLSKLRLKQTPPSCSVTLSSFYFSSLSFPLANMIWDSCFCYVFGRFAHCCNPRTQDPDSWWMVYKQLLNERRKKEGTCWEARRETGSSQFGPMEETHQWHKDFNMI